MVAIQVGEPLECSEKMTVRPNAEAIRSMPIGTAVHARTFALCESLNYREWSGYYAVSAYESHHEHEYNAIRNAAGAHRRLAALQVPGHRPRRGPPGRSADHARRLEDGRRAGVLHAVVRRARPGHRRRDRVAAGGDERSAGPPPIRACAGSGRTPRASTSRSRTSPRSSRRWRCRGRRRRALLRAVSDVDIDSLKYFRVTSGTHRRRAGRHLAHRLHRRSRLRDLDAGGRTRCACGTR